MRSKPIEVKALTKRYGVARGVDDLSFQIEPGEVFGYLGPNGSGKTTTIRCLMGLLRATRGECWVLGQRVLPGKAIGHDRIGYLPGDFRIWGGHSGGKALAMLGALGHSATIQKRQQQLAERLDLNLRRKVRTLSKGNRQKIGLIYAFQHRPDLLILDEPTSGLDPLMRQVVLDMIREAAEAGATVLLSSHDLSEVAAVCHRAAILREGRLVELAPISQIVQCGQRRLKIWFTPGTEVPLVTEAGLADVHELHRDSQSLEIAYQGTLDGVLKWLSGYAVERVTTPQTSLEEAFMQYYQEGDGHE